MVPLMKPVPGGVSFWWLKMKEVGNVLDLLLKI
jgi:hypothetical protein